MSRGRQSFYMEGWKFAVYLSLPIVVSLYYDRPENQKRAADYWQYVKYPANPASFKETIELAQQQQQQREAYRQQVAALVETEHRRKRALEEEEAAAELARQRRWYKFWQWGRSSSAES